MSDSQKYIGIKNGVVVCINSYVGYDLAGEFYHGYSELPVRFENAGELLTKLEHLFDVLNFPFAATNIRHFDEGASKRSSRAVERPYNVSRIKEERVKVMNDNEILHKHGDEGTFIVRVQQRQNSSWQGRITWVDEDKTVYFRSVWEMMKLIDAALESKEDGDEKNASSWE